MFFGVALSLSYIYILDILCECVTWFFPWGSLFSTKFLPRNRRNRSWQAKASQARGTWRRIGSVHLAELGCSRNGVSSGTPKWWWTIPFKWMIWGYLTSETSKWRFQNGVYSWKKERLLVIVDFQVPGLIGKCHLLACIAGLLAKFQCLVRWMSTLQRQILSNPHLELSINGGTLYNIYIYTLYIYIYASSVASSHSSPKQRRKFAPHRLRSWQQAAWAMMTEQREGQLVYMINCLIVANSYLIVVN